MEPFFNETLIEFLRMGVAVLSFMAVIGVIIGGGLIGASAVDKFIKKYLS